MPRLICADLFVGRGIRVNGVAHRLVSFENRGATVVLLADSGDTAPLVLSRSELLAQLTDETAALEDETEEPERSADAPVVTFGYLTAAELLHHLHKMVLLRHLMPHARQSPRSPEFIGAFENAGRLLAWLREASLVSTDKNWSAKTLNDLLRRWRRAGGAIAAFRVQLVPARRKLPSAPRLEVFRGIVRRIARLHPTVSAATIHRMATAEFRMRPPEESPQGPDSAAGSPPPSSFHAGTPDAAPVGEGTA